MSTMKTRITNQSIILFRDGRRIKIAPNKQVELTEEELADLKRMSPDAVRTPRNEAETVTKMELPKPGDAKAGGKRSSASDDI